MSLITQRDRFVDWVFRKELLAIFHLQMKQVLCPLTREEVIIVLED
jgi:hypothetical protein